MEISSIYANRNVFIVAAFLVDRYCIQFVIAALVVLAVL